MLVTGKTHGKSCTFRCLRFSSWEPDMQETGHLHRPLYYFVSYLSEGRSFCLPFLIAVTALPISNSLLSCSAHATSSWRNCGKQSQELDNTFTAWHQGLARGAVWAGGPAGDRKGGPRLFVRCEGVVLCPCGGNTDLLGDEMYFLRKVGWIPLRAGVHFTLWCLKSALLKASALTVLGAESCFLLFAAGLWYTAFSGDSVHWFVVDFCFPNEVGIFPPWMKPERSCDELGCSIERRKKNLPDAKSTSVYTNWTLLWLQDKEQKKSYLFIKSIIWIERS